MARNIAEILSPGDTFIDLGANEGYFSVIVYSRVEAKGKVICIQPQPALKQIIEKNLDINSIENLTIVEKIVGDQGGVAEFFLSPNTNTGSSGTVNLAKYSVPSIKIERTKLRDIFDDLNFSHSKLIKIDIEGGEAEAILGSPELFVNRMISAISLELHPRQISAKGRRVEELTDFLSGCGYTQTSRRGLDVWLAPNADI